MAHHRHVPAIELELGRMLAGTQELRAASSKRIEAFAATAEPARFAEIAARQRMTALLAERLRGAGLEGSPAASALKQTDRRLGLRALLLQGTGELVMSALGDAQVPALPLKGVGLAARLYGDQTLRDATDVDVLVDAEQLRRAAEVATDLGYNLVRGRLDRLPRLHLTFVDPARILPPLELHWRIHWYEGEFAARMLARCTDVGGTRVPQATDDLASLLLFYHRDGFVGLRLAADVAAVWDRRQNEIEAGSIGTLVTEHPELARALTSAVMVAERVVGLPARRLLGATVHVDRRTRRAASMDNWSLSGAFDQIRAEVMLVDGMCTPTRQAGSFLVRALVLSAPELRLPPGSSPLRQRLRGRMLYALHPFKILTRFVLALGFRRTRLRGPGAS